LLIFPNVAILSLLLNKDILTPLNPDENAKSCSKNENGISQIKIPSGYLLYTIGTAISKKNLF